MKEEHEIRPLHKTGIDGPACRKQLKELKWEIDVAFHSPQIFIIVDEFSGFFKCKHVDSKVIEVKQIEGEK